MPSEHDTLVNTYRKILSGGPKLSAIKLLFTYNGDQVMRTYLAPCETVPHHPLDCSGLVHQFSDLFTVYLPTLSIAHTTQSRMLRWLMNNKLEIIWKETTVAKFKVLSRHLAGETAQALSVGIKSLWTEI
jgi:hypothetical protein